MKASIDIGTNTALLLVAEVEDGSLQVIYEEQRVPRLGQGVDKARQLSAGAMERVVNALTEYRKMVASDFPSVESIEVTATSAVRDAQNRNEFLQTIEDKTGLKVRVLSGFEEALYTFLGAQTVLFEFQNDSKVVIDIGGGSTEIAYGDRRIQDRYSFDMGCVRFTERFLQDDPPSEKQLDACRKAIQQMLNEYTFGFADDASLIGVAGTVTSLAYIDKRMEIYDSKTLAGHKMSAETIASYIHRFQTMSSSDLVESYPEVMEGRADIFLAGLLILEGFITKYGFEEVITSTGGIRHGALLGK